MKVLLDCIPCYLKQAISVMNAANIDTKRQEEVIYVLCKEMEIYHEDKTPGETSTALIRRVHELIGNNDPFNDKKRESNDLAMSLYNELLSKVNNSSDSLYEALAISVAGNVIDMGITRDFNVHDALEHIIEKGFSINHYEEFKKKLAIAKKVLILGDNSGEIVFDKLIVNELNKLGKEVLYVVKEEPVLNDATMEDAIYVGMDKLTKVITNGTGILGTSMDNASEEFKVEYKKADIIISKGQANFESLESEPSAKGRAFFLLKLKCEFVAKVAQGTFGDMVFI